MARCLVSALQFKKGNQLAANSADAWVRFVSYGAVYDAPDSLRARASSIHRDAQRGCGSGRNLRWRQDDRDAMHRAMRVPPQKKNKPTKVWRKKRRKS